MRQAETRPKKSNGTSSKAWLHVQAADRPTRPRMVARAHGRMVKAARAMPRPLQTEGEQILLLAAAVPEQSATRCLLPSRHLRRSVPAGQQRLALLLIRRG